MLHTLKRKHAENPPLKRTFGLTWSVLDERQIIESEKVEYKMPKNKGS